MGGRGSKSATSSSLPNNAKAMRVTFNSGMDQIYFAGDDGRVFTARDTALYSRSLAGTEKSIRELYDTAIGKGYGVELISAEAIRAAQAERSESSRQNARIIAQAEVKPGSPTVRLSRQQGRIRQTRSRG